MIKKGEFTKTAEALLYDIGASFKVYCKTGKECLSKKNMAYVVSKSTPEAPGRLTTSVDYVEKTVLIKSVPRNEDD